MGIILHRHGRNKMVARNMYVHIRDQGRLTWRSMGLWCPVCGFTPGPVAKALMKKDLFV